MSVNTVSLLGRLGQDPEIKRSQSGMNICKFTLATSESFTKDGQKQEKTEWHNVVVFGKSAEACSKYLKKGSMAFVDGKITYTTSEGKDGQKKYFTSIVAKRVEFLDSKSTEQKPAGFDSIPF